MNSRPTDTGHEPTMISIVTPAHNEERHLRKLRGFDPSLGERRRDRSSTNTSWCSTAARIRTEEIAREFGCVIVRDDTRNLSHIRNSGAAVAKGEILVTIDADSWSLGKHALRGRATTRNRAGHRWRRAHVARTLVPGAGVQHDGRRTLRGLAWGQRWNVLVHAARLQGHRRFRRVVQLRRGH